MRCRAVGLVVCLASVPGLAAAPLPREAGVLGIHIAKPVGEEFAQLMATGEPSPSGDRTGKPFSGTAVLLEAVIPPIYGLAGDIRVATLSDDTGTNLAGNGSTAKVLPRDGESSMSPKGSSAAPDQFCITTPRLPRSGARKIEGSIIVPVFPMPEKMLRTMDATCDKGMVFESKFVQCKIRSREPKEESATASRASALNKKLLKDWISFEISSPGAGTNFGEPVAGSKPSVIDVDRMRQNLRIRLLKVDVVNSLGGRVIAEVSGINPDANATQIHRVEIPADVGNIRFQFRYYEANAVENLDLSFSSGLGMETTE